MSVQQEILSLTRRLLEAIARGDWEEYCRLCDPTLSAFEPEARGHLVEGMEFHRFYFDRGGVKDPSNTTISQPHVRLLGDDAAVVSYTRLIQHLDPHGAPVTSAFQETRVWHRSEDGWRNVHFHRST